MDDSLTAPVSLPISTPPPPPNTITTTLLLPDDEKESNVEPVLLLKEEANNDDENKVINEPEKLPSSQNPDYIINNLVDDDEEEKKDDEESKENKDEMIVELPHPDVLESLYPKTMTEIDLHWSEILVQKPTIIIEEAAKPYNKQQSLDDEEEELQMDQIKVYLKRKGMTRGRNYPLSELRGGTQHLLGLYRRHYNQAMRILSMIKEEIDRATM